MKLIVCVSCLRYYGESLPFNGNKSRDPAVLGYLTSEQALADFAQLITYLKVSEYVLYVGYRCRYLMN